MNRTYCLNCLKAAQACFCHEVTQFKNEIRLIILQHPTETKHPLGTAIISRLSFINSEIFIGENFNANTEVQKILESPQTYLLFPGDSSQTITPHRMDIKTLVILDGTWKKAKKILYLNKKLQELPRLSFQKSYISQYKIRKEPKPNYLSTVEASVYALEEIEQKEYKEVLRTFDYILNFQIEKMGKDIFNKFYFRNN